MAGVCGVLGDRTHRIDWLSDDLQWIGEGTTTAYDDEYVAVRSVSHPGAERAQPASTRSGALVWVWGNVWGYDGPDGYRSRLESDTETIAGFCARWYEAHGIEFAAGLNGTFAAVIYDREEGTAFVLTDRLGTHPVYYARPRPESFVFSTQLQSLPTYPGVDAAFDVECLCEYFALGSVSGLRTPFTGVRELPPSSVTTVDLVDGTTTTRRYWRPRFEPLDRPFSYFVDEFVERFEAVLADRLDPDLRYGLLLSGGSDSRAILAGIDGAVDLCTYHATGWQSRETRVTERVAETAGAEIRTLTRDRDTHERMLETAPQWMNFHGRFCEAHLTDFTEQLRDEVDVVISGLGGDTLFKSHAFPVPELPLGPLGNVTLPAAQTTTSADEFVARRATELPGYLDAPAELAEILGRGIETDDRLSRDGIECESVDGLVFFDDFYPFSNKSDFFYHALNGIAPHWSPFFDNRLVDLALRLPLKHRVRRNVVDAAVGVFDERLAAIPHATTGVPLSCPFPVDFVWHHANEFARKFLSSDEPPEAHLAHGPWPDMNGLIRSHDFVEKKLREKAALIDALPFLDADGVEQCYQDELDGANNCFELYTLLSFLQMPVVERLALGETSPREGSAGKVRRRHSA